MGHRRLDVSLHFLIEALKKTETQAFRVAANPLPVDAICVGMYPEPMRNVVSLVVQHPSWDGPPDGHQIPHLDANPLLETMRVPPPDSILADVLRAVSASFPERAAVIFAEVERWKKAAGEK